VRQFIGVTPKGPTTFVNVRRDETGEPLLFLDKDEVTKLRVNFTDWLESGETITSATVVARNCTASLATSSPNCDITLSAATSRSDGDVTLKVTSSTAQVWRGVIKVRQTNRYGDESTVMDYV
jgi:hypothetical protein